MDDFRFPLSRALRDTAMAYPGTTEGASCVNRAFKAGGKKNFLFVGEKDGRCKVMLKLDASADEARGMGQTGPGEVSVGAIGWVTAWFGPDDAPDAAMLTRWVDESFRLLAPRSVVEQLDG